MLWARHHVQLGRYVCLWHDAIVPIGTHRENEVPPRADLKMDEEFIAGHTNRRMIDRDLPLSEFSTARIDLEYRFGCDSAVLGRNRGRPDPCGSSARVVNQVKPCEIGDGCAPSAGNPVT